MLGFELITIYDSIEMISLSLDLEDLLKEVEANPF